ncbi:SH3 domain-containing protein [Candidatus Oscillochloris fontis]|uniref:SH3 domain-containing protein n=1 Tax=Candidatus Oscillochloris fontis TaxID=2496868 RepID=UPI00101D094F|nr:SH3 domain-containing protein [Candidatus Oscillochloris fontis]
MPSNNEMYALGASDAEHDDLNTFYYQHYYYYRKGYDTARRQLRGGLLASRPRWLLPLVSFVGGAVTLLLLILLISWLRPASPVAEQPSNLPSPISTLEDAATPTPTDIPTIIPTPTPTLRVGGRAEVINLNGSTLRVRDKPSLATDTQIVGRIPQGSQIQILEGPRQVDGLVWWRISDQAVEGWVVERDAEGVVFLQPR